MTERLVAGRIEQSVTIVRVTLTIVTLCSILPATRRSVIRPTSSCPTKSPTCEHDARSLRAAPGRPLADPRPATARDGHACAGDRRGHGAVEPGARSAGPDASAVHLCRRAEG